jgi:hypothetical protein
MTLSTDREHFGRSVLGPMFAEFAFRLWLFAESQPRDARLLFCARGGLRLRLLYETFLERIGRTSPLQADELMVSRLVAARPALLARAPAALDEIGREFDGETMRAVVAALVQSDLGLSPRWDRVYERGRFERLLWADDGEAAAVRAAVGVQASLFRSHLAEKSQGRRVILCDTGLYGSTMRLLGAAYPHADLFCVMFARSNYKGFATEHFARTCGLCVESDFYSTLDLRASVLRFWQLIEHVLEPDLDSVRTFVMGEDGRPRCNLERPGWREAVRPGEGEIFAGVLSYVDGFSAPTFHQRLYDDSARAWPEFKRRVTRPRRSDVAVLSIGERSRDFGRDEKIDAIVAGSGLSQLKASLWREGAATRAHPALRGVLHGVIELAHAVRQLRRAFPAQRG